MACIDSSSLKESKKMERLLFLPPARLMRLCSFRLMITLPAHAFGVFERCHRSMACRIALKFPLECGFTMAASEAKQN